MRDPLDLAVHHAKEASHWAAGEKSWTNYMPANSEAVYAADAATAQAHAATAQAWAAIATARVARGFADA